MRTLVPWAVMSAQGADPVRSGSLPEGAGDEPFKMLVEDPGHLQRFPGNGRVSRSRPRRASLIPEKGLELAPQEVLDCLAGGAVPHFEEFKVLPGSVVAVATQPIPRLDSVVGDPTSIIAEGVRFAGRADIEHTVAQRFVDDFDEES